MMNHAENEKELNEKMNGALRIFGALSSVDEELLARCEEKEKVIPFRKYTKVMTACASILVVGVVTWTGVTLMSNQGSKEMAADCAAPESYYYSADDSALQNESPMEWEDGALEEAEVMADCDAAPTDDRGAAAEESVEENKSAATGSSDVPAEKEELSDGVVMDWGPVVNTTKYQKLADAKMVEPFGQYIPSELPAGYVFESASSIEGENGAADLCLYWRNGMDSIMLYVGMYEENAENESRIVDIAKEETYNVHLYEIPYASSVPDEIRLTFNSPIFREEDMSLEVVRARMKSVSDAGDTDTPRGDFSVLYDEGILVVFNGRGSAEEIWNMYLSINAQ